MATLEPLYGAIKSLVVTNLQSLADDAYWQSNAENNSADNAVNVDVLVTLLSTTTAGDAAGYADVFMSSSLDGGTKFTGEASGSEGSYAPQPSEDEQAKNLIFLGRVAMKADETTAREFRAFFSTPSAFKVPERYSFVIVNRSGAALASSGNKVEIMKNKIQTV